MEKELLEYLNFRAEELWEQYARSEDNSFRFQRRHRAAELEMLKSKFFPEPKKGMK